MNRWISSSPSRSRRLEIRSVWSTKRRSAAFQVAVLRFSALRGRCPLIRSLRLTLRSLPRGSRPTDIALRAPSRSLGHQQRFFQDRSPIKSHSMRSVWRPVRVFTPNGLLSGGGRHTERVRRTICGHLPERSNCVFSDIAYLYTENS